MTERRPHIGNIPVLGPYEGTFSEEEIHDILSGINHDGNGASNQFHTAEDGVSGVVVSTSPDDVKPEAKTAVRSERKRSREKQRRSDVNKHFSDLTALLRKIESEGENPAKRMRHSTTPPTNRVDLLNRTIAVLEMVHDENKAKKAEIEDLKKKVDEANQIAEDTAARLKEATQYQNAGVQKQVMMMVPMMMPHSGGMQNNSSNASCAVQAPMMMPQHMIMMAQPPQPVSAPTPAPSNMVPMARVEPQSSSGVNGMHSQQLHVASLPQSNPPLQQQPNSAQLSVQNQEQPHGQQSVQGQRKDNQTNPQSSPQTVPGGNLAHCA